MQIEIPTWPDELADRYRALGYWRHETLSGFLRDRARRYAERTALVDAAGRLSYAEFDGAVDATAARLAALGIAPGDRAIVQLPNRRELYLALLGLSRLGAIPIHALPAHRAAELGSFAEHAAPKAAILGSWADEPEPRIDRAALLGSIEGPLLDVRILLGDAEPEDPDGGVPADGIHRWRSFAAPSPTAPARHVGDDPGRAECLAFLQVSGGSTGIPKLIPRTHADYLYSVRASAEICALDEASVMLIAIPAAHNFPMSSPGALGVWDRGGAVVLAPGHEPAPALDLIEREGATIVPLVPPLAQAWLAHLRRHPRSLPTLRIVQVGGAALAPEVAPRIEEAFGATLQQVYGMAEGLVSYTRLDDDPQSRWTARCRPISPDDELRIIRADGTLAEHGEIGELETQGPYTIRGYYGRTSANARSFAADGWYRSGDLAALDEHGRIRAVGRAGTLINRGGEKVAPEEVEAHLLADPGIADAVVDGVPDPFLGERTRARLVLQAGAERAPGEIRAHLRRRGLAEYKLPDVIDFAASLELTAVGKLSRRPGAGADPARDRQHPTDQHRTEEA